MNLSWPLFSVFQQPILTIANSQMGRRYLGITRDMVLPSEKIVRLFPNAPVIETGRSRRVNGIYRPEYKAVFKGYDIYTKRFKEMLAMAGSGLIPLLAYRQPQFIPLFIGTVSPFTAHSSDGVLQNNPTSTTWANVRSAASSNNALDTNGVYFGTQQYPNQFSCARVFTTFLTGTTIPVGSNVTAATWSIYAAATPHTDSNWTVTHNSICLTESTQASATSVATSDFDAYTSLDTPNEFITRQLLSAMTGSAYNDYVNNANGIAHVKMGTGVYTMYMVRPSGDIDNVQPGAATCYCQFDGSTSEDAGQEPKLSVTWAAAEMNEAAWARSTEIPFRSFAEHKVVSY